MPSTRAGRRYVVILIVQSVVMLMFLTYAIVQRTQAIRSREMASELQKEAERQAHLAEVLKNELDKCLQGNK